MPEALETISMSAKHTMYDSFYHFSKPEKHFQSVIAKCTLRFTN